MINMKQPWATVNTRLTRAILRVESSSNVLVCGDVLIYDADELAEAYDLQLNGLGGVRLLGPSDIGRIDIPKLQRWSDILESLMLYNKKYKVLEHEEYQTDPDEDFEEAQDKLSNGWVDMLLDA